MLRKTTFYVLILFLICGCADGSKKTVDEAKNSNSVLQNPVNAVQNKVTCSDKILGTYYFKDEYQDKYYLKISCVSGLTKAKLISPAPQGEHGMMYFVSEVMEVDLLDSSKIRFTSKNRDLFRSQPNLNNYDSLKETEISGGESFSFTLIGEITNNRLRLSCKAKLEGDCYFEQIELVKNNR